MSGLFARYSCPLAKMLSAGSGSLSKARACIGAPAQVGCPGPWADWLGCVMRSLPFPNSLLGKALPQAFVLLPYAVVGSDIQTDCCNLLHGWLLSIVIASTATTLWHSDAGGGAVHGINGGHYAYRSLLDISTCETEWIT